VEAGAIVLQKEVLDSVPEEVKFSLEDGIYRRLIEQEELVAHITGQRFYDIGTPEQQQVFQDFLEEGTR
ncbi:MAG: hypothetical protein HQ577_03510, partial [Dehalococcoidia bacterium]|nr:hypothetical protein [Dehalococcoidia bacterium]